MPAIDRMAEVAADGRSGAVREVGVGAARVARLPVPAWPPGTLLAGMDPRGREDLLRLGAVRRVIPKEILLLQGERSAHVFLLLSGWFKVTVTPDDGRETLLAIRTGGELVGEPAGLDGQPRVATVTSATWGSVRRIRADEFNAFLATHGDSARHIMRSMAEKLRWSTRRRQELGGRPAGARVARVVLDMASAYGHRRNGSLLLNAALTQADIAALAGTSQASAERVLRALRERGIIATGYRTIGVLDVEALTAVAQDAQP